MRDGHVLGGAPGASHFGGSTVNAASLAFQDCTFANNSVSGNAGVYLTANNGGDARGGAIYNTGTLTPTRGTFTRTTNGNGGDGLPSDGADGRGSGGLRALGGSTRVRNTLIAGNTRHQGGGPDVDGIFTSSGYNLIGISNGGSGFTHAADRTGTLAAPLDARLAAIGNRGGPTDTPGHSSVLREIR